MLGRRQFAKLGVLAAPAFSIISNAYAADDELKLALDDASQVTAHNVTVRAVNYRGGRALEVRRVALGKPDIDTFAFVPDVDFHNGTIEVDVSGGVLPDAPPGARGFIGIVFRVETIGNAFACEGLYLRPTNGRADDQVRRNHSTQYFSFPGYDFDRLRRESPGQYEFIRRSRARRVDNHACRGAGGGREASCCRGFSALPRCERSQTWAGRARQRGPLC